MSPLNNNQSQLKRRLPPSPSLLLNKNQDHNQRMTKLSMVKEFKKEHQEAKEAAVVEEAAEVASEVMLMVKEEAVEDSEVEEVVLNTDPELLLKVKKELLLSLEKARPKFATMVTEVKDTVTKERPENKTTHSTDTTVLEEVEVDQREMDSEEETGEMMSLSTKRRVKMNQNKKPPKKRRKRLKKKPPNKRKRLQRSKKKHQSKKLLKKKKFKVLLLKNSRLSKKPSKPT